MAEIAAPVVSPNPQIPGLMQRISGYSCAFLMPIMNAFKYCRSHPVTIARTVLAVSAMASSIYVMIEGDRPWAEDEIRKMFWCFSIVGNCLLSFLWSLETVNPYTFFFLAISIGFFFLTKLSDGAQPTLERFLPALPLSVISGSFLASLYLRSPPLRIMQGMVQEEALQLDTITTNLPPELTPRMRGPSPDIESRRIIAHGRL